MAWIEPQWPAPATVRALTTLRTGGVSEGPFASWNLAAHVGDDPAAVRQNRERLREATGLSAEPAWLTQVHGTDIVGAEAVVGAPRADGSVTRRAGTACVVLTADCLPVLFCSRDGTAVGAAHAGWRGLVAGVLEQTVRSLACSPDDVLAWLGPAIGPTVYEVGPEVRAQFLDSSMHDASAFVPSPTGRWHADLYALARGRLARAGVSQTYGGGFCTFTESARFWSYRREPLCGRMASLIWIQAA